MNKSFVVMLTMTTGMIAFTPFPFAAQQPTTLPPLPTRILVRGFSLPGIAGTPATPDAALLVGRDGRVEAIGPALTLSAPAGAVSAPDDATIVNLAAADGRRPYVIPGLVAAHVHISDIDGAKPRSYSAANTARQLALFARYGVTTLFSLGGEQAPAFAARAEQAAPGLSRARLRVAGQIVTGATPEAARQAVDRVADSGADIIKIRVDDNLGATQKMPPAVFEAVIAQAHARGLRVAAHLFYLDDAKALLRAGVDFIAHSVRDRDVDDEFIALMKARNVPYCPTLTRELATFVYEATPAFFSDPFFSREADPDLVAQLQQPARQQTFRNSTSGQRYKQALEVAKRNLKRLADAGVLIAMGTDSGAAPERFEGYFEHLELEMMVDAGLSPAQALESATVGAARAMRLDDVGVLRPGAHADFVVLDANPVDDIRATRAIASVWIDGRPIPNRTVSQ